MSSEPVIPIGIAAVDDRGWPYRELKSLTPPGKRNAIVDGPFGSNLKTEHYRSSGIPIITSGFVTTGKFSASRYIYVDQEKFDQEKRSAVYPGDIVMAKIGARCGASAVLPRDHPVGILSGNALKISIDESKHSTEYVAVILRWLCDRGDLDVLRSTGAQPAISMPLLKRLVIPTPPLAEQRRIAEAVFNADEHAAGLEQLIAKKQAIKQGMMQQHFTVHIQNGERSALGSIASFFSGGTPDRSKAEYWSGDIPWISAATLKHVEVSTSDQHVTARAARAASRMAPLGSTLVLVRGSALHSEIRASLVTAPVCFNQDVKALVPGPQIVPKFLTYSIHANADRLLRLVTSAGNTAGVLDTKVLKAFELWVPPHHVQEHVVSVFNTVTEELDLLAAKLDKAQAMKQGMMQELLTGRTRLPVADGAA
jgi:type I restriction enzyme, S subunit